MIPSMLFHPVYLSVRKAVEKEGAVLLDKQLVFSAKLIFVEFKFLVSIFFKILQLYDK